MQSYIITTSLSSNAIKTSRKYITATNHLPPRSSVPNMKKTKRLWQKSTYKTSRRRDLFRFVEIIWRPMSLPRYLLQRNWTGAGVFLPDHEGQYPSDSTNAVLQLYIAGTISGYIRGESMTDVSVRQSREKFETRRWITYSLTGKTNKR